MTVFRSNTPRGFSTIELMVALAVMVTVITAVVLLSFGSQAIVGVSQANGEALNMAQEMLEESQALARKDFRLVNPIAETTDGIFRKRLEVQTQSDYLTKRVVATVTWTGEHNVAHQVELATLVTNFEYAVGGDTCDSVPTGDWAHPSVKNATTDLAALVSDGGATYTIRAVDAYQQKLFVVGDAGSPIKETFFVFAIANPASPSLVGKLDNSVATNEGYGAVATDGQYAYVVSTNPANYSTCSAGVDCAQLQVIDVRTPASPSLIAAFKLPGVGGSAGLGRSIFYKDGFVYVGLAATGQSNWPEFHIIDVHNPALPVHAGSVAFGASVNDISVRGTYAYVIHDLGGLFNEQLTVLDVSTPSHPIRVSGYLASDGQGNGRSSYTVGNTLYLGRSQTAANAEYVALDNTNPRSIPASPYFTAGLGDTPVDFVVRHNLLMNVSATRLEVRNLSSVATVLGSLNLPASSGSNPVLDCEGNVLYVASNDASGRGHISAIAP